MSSASAASPSASRRPPTYATADAAAHPKPGQSPQQKAFPATIIDKPPVYGTIPDLKWGDDDGGDGFIRSLLEHIPQVVRDVLQPVIKKAFRVGKLADVYPYPEQHYLNSLSQSWADTTICLNQVSDSLTGAIGTITNPQQADWEDAMKVFCSALWGSTAWGHSRDGIQWAQKANAGPQTPFRPTGSQPVMTVLRDTGMKISNILREYAEAAVELNGDIWDEYLEAVKEAAKALLDDVNLKDGVSMKDVGGLIKGAGKGVGMMLEFDVQLVLKLDTADINRIVDKYLNTLTSLTSRVEALMAPLDEAYLSAPKFEAGVARAHGFGARALDEFRHQQKWMVQDSNGNQVFDLASNEYLGGGHSLDKHVGKTDEQLAQRLRDQADPPTAAWPHNKPKIGGSSSFPNMERAQDLTEHNLRNKRSEIEAWLATNPTNGQTKDFTSPAPNGETSGRYVSKQPVDNEPGTGFKQHGLNARAMDVKNVKTVLKYDSSLDPPYIIFTSMPAP
ncbi:hypothetical protein NLX86_09685 [Streptomyces sp. A3M-1-3]|uniref:RNase A-like domain-containing protein n=1 Tax=Streptomyces sp. A3M-1-3 TaxID=2962044 RepID=UPI0020B77743|nr:RNase A-like domain-containing protein [Streptomyces sp. A3M-1-3]MCP3818377.1 hypothetical protein [Streptomyces sp. A3M-1-3]